jgi:hypothetical protein
MVTPYFVFTIWEGKLSKVHMPSSANAVAAAQTVAAAMAADRMSFTEGTSGD